MADASMQVVLTTANVLRFAVRMWGGFGQLLQKVTVLTQWLWV